MKFTSLLQSLVLLLPLCGAVTLDTDDFSSIQAATNLLATGLMDYYNGYEYGGVVGMFDSPYYWWEAGGAMGGLIDNWYFFDNDTYESIIMDSLIYQAGEDWNYMPLNQTTTEGNDDQTFWGIAAIQAAERNFTNPDESTGCPGWLYLAQAVFNTMAWRWDSADCNGGLRWQIFEWNSGYDYKNTISNAGLFHIGARLARYTSNDTYVQWCEEIYDWLLGVEFIVESEYYYIYDGASIEDNCSTITKYQWTYNAALIIGGCAYLYNYTEDEVWLDRVNGHLKSSSIFFFNSSNQIMYEAACQGSGNCGTDQRSFKTYLARFLGTTSLLVPSTYDDIRELLVASAQGAAQSCTGGYDGHTCGLNWFYDGWDGFYGLGEQMAALEVMQALVVNTKDAPYTADNGGSSTGDGAAGSASGQTLDEPLDLSTKDTAGAAVITAVIGISIISGIIWLMV